MTKLNTDSLSHSVCLYMVVFCGTIPVKILKGFLFHEESVLENYCLFHNEPTVIYCLC